MSGQWFKVFCLSAVLLVPGCGGGGGVSVLPSTEEFTEYDTLNPKMDILWVIDNSVSMKQEIQNVVANINSFISIYIDKGYDFRMGVIPTSAWSIEAYHELQETGINPTRFPDLDFLLHPSDGLDTFSRLHTGECTNTNSGFKVIDTKTPNIQENFEKNLNVFGRLDNDSATHCGFNHIGGNPPDTTHSRYVSFTHDYYYGQRSKDNDGNIIHWSNSDRGRMSNFIADERPLQSMRAFLNLSPDAELLIREDAFLAVILVTDEMDGSSYSLNPCHNAGDGVCDGDQPQHIDEDGNRIFHEVSVYTDFLDSYKGSTDLYNMYAIAKPGHANKRAQLGTVAVNSGGFNLNVDGSQEEYLDYLLDITTNIVRDATAYKLKCEPNLDTLEVIFQTPGDDPISVPQADVNTGGWTYIETNKSLKFSEPYVPVDGTNVSVNYTGYTLNCENQ